jgi:hypothetical protein
MVTKAQKKKVFVIIFLCFFLVCFLILPKIKYEEEENKIELALNSPNEIVIDKVYNFTIEDPQLDFKDNLFFEKRYFYEIIFTVVSPHTCDMDITLWDPEGDQFFITSENNVTQFDTRTIPFGTALKGNYSARFEAVFLQNLNIHIRIEQKDKCLFDKIEFNEREDIIHYNVAKFFHGMTIAFTLYFKTDMYYKFFFERVSTISIILSNYVALDHTILDPQEINFRIYQNESIGYIYYYLGTAIAGLYNINITMYSYVDCVNIAYAVVEKEEISDVVDPNDPDIPLYNPPVNNTGDGIKAFIPLEGTIITLLFIGLAIFIPIMIIIRRRKRNSSSI